MKRILIPVFASILGLLIVSPIPKVFALEIKQSEKEEIIIKEGERASDNLFIIAPKITFQGEAEKDVFALAGEVEIKGKIKGNLFVVAANLNISGEIEGDVFATAQNINTLASNIGGKIYKYQFELPKTQPPSRVIWGELIGLLATAVVGFLFWRIFPGFLLETMTAIRTSLGQSLLWGVLLTFLSPFAFLVLLLSLVGIPLALISLAIFLILGYLSQIFVGLVLSKFLLPKSPNFFLSLLLGLVILRIVFYVPFLGGVLKLLTFFLGIGGAFLALRQKQIIKPGG